MKGFILKPHEAQALAAGKPVVIWRALKKPLYTSHENPPRFKDTKKGDWFLCPDVFPTSDNPGMVIVECLDVGTYHSMGNRQFCEKHAPFPVDVPLFGKETWVWRDRHQGSWSVQDFILNGGEVVYKSDGAKPFDAWISSVHMPERASRITLTISDVKVRRPQDADEADILASGVGKCPKREGLPQYYTFPGGITDHDPVSVLMKLIKTPRSHIYHFTALATLQPKDS